jgi:hypothetical protein
MSEQTNSEQGVPQQGSSGEVSEAQDHGFGVDEDNHGWAPDVGASGPGEDRGAGHKAWEANDTQDAATDRRDDSSSS